MEQIKKQIIDLLWKSADTVHGKGSCGELGDSFQAIDAECFSDIANEITNLIQLIFASEKQQNKLGVKNPFEEVQNDFDKAVEPAIRYLLKNHNPHTKIYIDYSSAELLQGQQCHNLNKEVPD